MFSRKGSRKQNDLSSRIEIGDLRLPPSMESRHVLLTGSTGSGKTVALRRIVSKLRTRGDAVVVIDAGAELMEEFGSSRDIILSPLDARSHRWEPGDEVETVADYPRLAQALIPRAPSNDGETWAAYARSLVQAVLEKVSDIAELEDFLFQRPSYPLDPENPLGDSLAEQLQDTSAHRLFAPGASRMLASILSVVSSNLAWLRYASEVTGPRWSARKWASGLDSKQSPWIWIPVRPDQVQLLAPYATAVVEQIIVQTLSLSPSSNRRVWIFADELGQYPAIPSLTQWFTQGRKFGARGVVGMQSVAQLKAAYGWEGSQTLLSCLGTKLLLRAGDAETALWASREIGEREIRRKSQTEGDHGWSTSESSAIEAAVLPSELRALPDRRGYLILPGDWPVTKIKIPIPARGGPGVVPLESAPWVKKSPTEKSKPDPPSDPTEAFEIGWPELDPPDHDPE